MVLSVSEKVEHLYLEVTSRCNLRCDHCSVRSWGRPVPDPAYEVLSTLTVDFHAQGGRFVTFSGGEPGLRPDLPALIAASQGMEVTVFSNGIAATREVLEQLAAASGRLAISIDGPSAEIHDSLRGAGAFAKALSAIRRGVASLTGERVILSCVLSRPLLPHIDELWQFARELGIGILYLGIFEPLEMRNHHPTAPTAKEMVDPILRLTELAVRHPEILLLFSESHDLLMPKSIFSKRLPKHVLGRTVKVQADGWALPGPFFYESRFRLGRPAEDGWAPVLASPVYQELTSLARRRIQRVGKCSECFWSVRCSGGSLALTWAAGGDWDTPCPLCELYQVTLERAARRYLGHESSPHA